MVWRSRFHAHWPNKASGTPRKERTVKTLIIATVTITALGSAFAYAGPANSQTPDTYVTGQSGVMTQPSVTSTATQPNNQGGAGAYIANHSVGTWLFAPNENEGSNN
jgi:hypothetical protein